MKRTVRLNNLVSLERDTTYDKRHGETRVNSETLTIEFIGNTVTIIVWPKHDLGLNKKHSRLVLKDLLEFTSEDPEKFIKKISEIFGNNNKEGLLAASLIKNNTFKGAIGWLAKRHGVLTAAKLTINGREVITPFIIK